MTLKFDSVADLANALQAAEQAHAKSGDSAENWPMWYARYIASKYGDIRAQWLDYLTVR